MPKITIWNYEAKCRICGDRLLEDSTLDIIHAIGKLAAFMGAHADCGFGSISATGWPYRLNDAPRERGMLDDVTPCAMDCEFQTNLASRMADHFITTHLA